MNEAIVVWVYTHAKAHSLSYANYLIHLVFNSCGRNHVQANRLYVCMCVCICVCMYVCMYVCVYMYVCVCMYEYVCVYMCMYVCICVCVCM